MSACEWPCHRHFNSEHERTRTVSALPDDQYDIILKHLGVQRLRREEQKGVAKTALNKCRCWKLFLKGTVEAAYGGKEQQRLLYSDSRSGRQLIVIRQSEIGFLVDFFHKEYSGVGAEKLSYIMGQVYVCKSSEVQLSTYRNTN